MIKPQIIKERNKPIAVILDYRYYQDLLEDAQDKCDYRSAIKTKAANRRWVSHARVKKALGI